MRRVGLTGSIATGKSTVLAMFAEAGIPTFSSDETVHQLYAGGPAVPLVAAIFPDVVHGDAVDREALARRISAAPQTLPALEAIVHPLVRERIEGFFAAAQRGGAALAVADIPLLFESGHDYGLDAIIVTAVDDATQRARGLGRPAMSEEKFAALLARQLPQADKKKRADHVIDTAAPIEATRAAVADLIRRLASG